MRVFLKVNTIGDTEPHPSIINLNNLLFVNYIDGKCTLVMMDDLAVEIDMKFEDLEKVLEAIQ